MSDDPFLVSAAANALGSFVADLVTAELADRRNHRVQRRLDQEEEELTTGVGNLLIQLVDSEDDSGQSAELLGALLTVELRDIVRAAIRSKLAGSYYGLRDRFVRTIQDSLPDNARLDAAALETALSTATDLVMAFYHDPKSNVVPLPAHMRTEAVVDLLAEISIKLRNIAEDAAVPARVSPAEVVTSLKITGRERNKLIPLPDFLALRREHLERLYVPPTLVDWVTNRRYRPAAHPWDLERELVLGNPGAGKSTLTRYVGLRMSSGLNTPAPVVMELRGLEVSIEEGLPALSMVKGACEAQAHLTISDGAIEYLLDRGKILLLLDGLDELTELEHRHQLLDIVNTLVARFPKTPMLLTSRLQGFNRSAIPTGFTASVIQDFSEYEVDDYASRWFGHDKRELAEQFISDSKQIADLRSNPLMLALICLLYESSKTIPDNRADLYSRCSQLMFREWDRHRRIKIGAEFDDFLSDALDELGFQLYFGLLASTLPLEELPAPPPSQLVAAYHSRSGASALLSEVRWSLSTFLSSWHVGQPGRAEDTADAFIDFCRTRLWTLTETAQPIEGEVSLGFVHKTFLEFHAASRLSRTQDVTYLTQLLLDGATDPGLATLLEIALQLKATSQRGLGDVIVASILESLSEPHRARLSAIKLVFTSVPLRPSTISALVRFWETTTLFTEPDPSDFPPDEFESEEQLHEYFGDLNLAWLATLCLAKRSARDLVANHLVSLGLFKGKRHAGRSSAILELLLTSPAAILEASRRFITVSDSVRFVTSFLELSNRTIDAGVLIDWDRVSELSPTTASELVRRRPTADVLLSAGVGVLCAETNQSDDRSGRSMIESILVSVFDKGVRGRLARDDWSLQLLRSIASLILDGRIDEFVSGGVDRRDAMACAEGLTSSIVGARSTVPPEEWMSADDLSIEESRDAWRIEARVGLAWLLWLADSVIDFVGYQMVSWSLIDHELLDFRALVELVSGLGVSDLAWRSSWSRSPAAEELIERFVELLDRTRTLQVVVIHGP